MDNSADFVKKLKELIIEAKAASQGAREEDSRRRITMSLGTEIANMLAPFLSELASTAKANKEEMREMAYELASAVNAREMAGIDTEPIVRAIQQTIGGMRLPEPKVTVTTPEIKIPRLAWPEGDMPINGWVKLMGVSLENPLPVQIRDAKGRPVDLNFGVTPLGGGTGGGGKADFFTIKGFTQSAFAELMNPDGRIRVELPAGSSGLTDAELRASAVPVSQVSGASWSTSASIVSVSDIFSTTAASSVVNPDNRVRVELPSGATGLTDTELRATAVPVAQVSGASWSTEATIPNTLDVRQVSGSVFSTVIESQSFAFETRQVSGGNHSVFVTGSSGTTAVVGDDLADAADSGGAPVKIGGIARTANPTAVTAGDRVATTHDDLGRILTRPVQVRDLTLTAYATLTTGTETTLRAAVAGAYLDLVYVMGANNSDVAVTVDIRPVTAGNIVMTLQIPANGTAGIACPVPLPQADTGNNWTADMADITGTTVYLTALFSQEI